MSSTYPASGAWTYEAQKAIDGNYATYCLSNYQSRPWLSVLLGINFAAGERVGYVLIHARQHVTQQHSSLHSFEEFIAKISRCSRSPGSRSTTVAATPATE